MKSLKGGVCDRCDSEIIQMEKEVWMLKITDYADKLLEELNNLDFPERVRVEQENWIGRSEGAEIYFKIKENEEKTLKVYTTRPDTIYGVTYMAIAPEHKILDELKDKITNFEEIENYRDLAKKKSEFERTQLNKEKTGVVVKGIECINPVTKENIPIVVTDYVMINYASGAIMGVPAHDVRDFEFASKFNIEIRQVIDFEEGCDHKLPYTGNGKHINSGILNGMEIKEAKSKMISYLEENGIGNKKVEYHMKDWAFARQRYWGEPVPIVKCECCGLVPLKEEDLPLKLPEVENFIPGEDGMSPLAKIDSWVNTTCPKCGRPAKRETDTMPQWAGSSWYFLRYTDPHNNNALASKENMKYWLPVDQYNGGMEHVTRHLIYSRFWHRFLYDIGVVPTKEPYKKRSTQGLILGPDGNKMSKSKGNVVNPDDIVKEYGADTLRTYIAFIGDYTQSAPWSEKGVKGAKKFLDRLMRITQFTSKEDFENSELEIELNKVIKKVTEDYRDMKFNTAIAAIMTYVNAIYKYDNVSIRYVKPLIQIISPVASHVAEEMWESLGLDDLACKSKWPDYDASKLVGDEVELAVLVNSVVRYKINVPSSADEKEIEKIAVQNEKLKQYLTDGKEIKKVIVVKSRMVNIVVK